MSFSWEQIADAYMKYVDKDRNGKLSKDELTDFFNFAAKNSSYKFDQTHFDTAFKKADSSADGQLTKEELMTLLKNL